MEALRYPIPRPRNPKRTASTKSKTSWLSMPEKQQQVGPISPTTIMTTHHSPTSPSAIPPLSPLAFAPLSNLHTHLSAPDSPTSPSRQVSALIANLLSTQQSTTSLPDRNTPEPVSTSSRPASQQPAPASTGNEAASKLAEALDDFLGDVERKFKGISEEILVRLDEMAERCDRLEGELLRGETAGRIGGGGSSVTGKTEGSTV